MGTINVIFATPGRTGSCPSRVMSVTRLSLGDINQNLKRAIVELPLVMGFSDEDHGHTIKDCRSLWDHLDQLVREGKLKLLLHHSSG